MEWISSKKKFMYDEWAVNNLAVVFLLLGILLGSLLMASINIENNEEAYKVYCTNNHYNEVFPNSDINGCYKAEDTNDDLVMINGKWLNKFWLRPLI